MLGAVTGLALVWVLSAAALLVPSQTRLRQEAQSSELLRRLDQAVPPRTLLNLLARIDPIPSIVGPAAPSTPPTPRSPPTRRSAGASASVVRVLGTACGIGVEGSGWFAAPRPRRHRGARRRRRARHDRRASRARRTAAPHGSSPSTRTTTSPCSASPARTPRRCRSSTRRTGTAVAIVGYPRERPARRGAGADRARRRSSHPGRARARPRLADDHAPSRARSSTATPAAPRSTRRRGRSRRSSPRGVGARRAATASRRRSSARARLRRRAGLDRLLRALGSARAAVDDAERLAERRHHVDAGSRRARAVDQLARRAPPRPRARPGPRPGSAPGRARARRCPASRCGCARALVASRIGQTPTSTGTGQVPPSRSRNAASGSRSNRICVIAKRAPAATLRWKRSSLELEVFRGRVDRDAGEERRRRVDRAAVPVLARGSASRPARRARSSPPRTRRASPGSRRPRAGRR